MSCIRLLQLYFPSEEELIQFFFLLVLILFFSHESIGGSLAVETQGQRVREKKEGGKVKGNEINQGWLEMGG